MTVRLSLMNLVKETKETLTTSFCIVYECCGRAGGTPGQRFQRSTIAPRGWH